MSQKRPTQNQLFRNEIARQMRRADRAEKALHLIHDITVEARQPMGSTARQLLYDRIEGIAADALKQEQPS